MRNVLVVYCSEKRCSLWILGEYCYCIYYCLPCNYSNNVLWSMFIKVL